MSNLRTQNGVEYDCFAIGSDHFEKGHTESQAMVPWESSNKYARWTMWFAIATIGLFMVLRIINHFTDKRYKQGKQFVIPLKNKLVGVCRWVGYRQIGVVSKYTVFPSNLGFLLYSAAAFLFMACICFIPKFWYRTCFKFGSPPMAVRAGLMSNALTPLIYGFAGKVNVITMLTGTSYEKLHFFHVLTAWLSIFFAWVHTVPFLVQPVWEGGASWLNHFFVTSIYDISGTVAIILLTVLCFFSLKSIRDRYYELFLHVHWPTAIVYFAILFWHDNNSLESWAYLWATLAVYGAGILYRYFKKTNYLQLRGNWFTHDVATISPLDDEAVQISVFTRTVQRWMPGEHIFIRFAKIQPFSNHPFTIATVPEYDKESGFARMRLVARPYSGFTRTLYEQALAKSETQYQVYWDGPYGGVERDVEAFDNVILACSGSGATAVIPFLKHFAQRLHVGARISTKSIKLLWVVRNSGAFSWFKNDIMAAMSLFPDPTMVQVLVHVTDEHDDKLECDGVDFQSGRPNIPMLFDSWADSLDKKTIVLSSGCASVRNDVANATAKLQTRVITGKADEVYLHTESFGW